MPSVETKLRLFCLARDRLIEAGYRAIGMDHFALPDDELVAALGQRRLHRNFMGYTVRMGTDLVGLGVSAIGEVDHSYAQNEKKLSRYYAALDAGRFPIERGRILDADDRVRRDVIRTLICHFHLDKAAIEARHGINFDHYFAAELAELDALGLPFVEHDAEHVGVHRDGRLFIRNLCMLFDRYLSAGQSKRTYSRTI